jgi:hypothetical protein
MVAFIFSFNANANISLELAVNASTRITVGIFSNSQKPVERYSMSSKTEYFVFTTISHLGTKCPAS